MKSYYNYLIKKSRATLFKLISLRGENADLKAEKLLKTCSIEVVETVSIILILGRDAYYDKQSLLRTLSSCSKNTMMSIGSTIPK